MFGFRGLSMLQKTWLPTLAAITCIFGAAGISPTLEAKEDETSSCLKKLSIIGFPHRLRTVAELNAVRAWTIQSEKKKGAEYALWHNARNNQLSCDKLERSSFYRCTASAKPCLPRTESVSQ